MKANILHSKATGFSVVADAADGMAVQITCETGEDAARLVVLLESANCVITAWNKAELTQQFAREGATREW